MRTDSAPRFYELMVITAPDGAPEELMATVDQIIGYITTVGGSIIRSNSDSPWGRRRLAYPIRYQSADVRDGFYTLIHLEIAPDKVIEIERDLKLNDRLMRYMVIQLSGEPVFPEPEEEQPTAESASGDEAGVTGDTAEAPSDESVVEEIIDTVAEVEVSEAPAEDSAEERRAPEADAAELEVEESLEELVVEVADEADDPKTKE